MPNVDDALALARRGFAIFPCAAAEKRPLTMWRDTSTTDEATITDWWAANPEANIGIDCGKSGIAVIDVDDTSSVDPMEQEHGELPTTLVALTGREGGGVHLYYDDPDGQITNSARKLWDGIDVRGNGGYVIAPPSVHESGRLYEWYSNRFDDAGPGQLEPFPDSYRQALEQEPERETPTTPVADGPERDTSDWGRSVLSGETAKVMAARPGTRNQQLFDSALLVYSAVKGGSLAYDDADTALQRAAKAAGLELKETVRTLESAWDIAKPRVPEDRPLPEPAATQTSSAAVRQPDRASLTGQQIDQPEPRPRGGGFRALDLEELATLPPPEWLLNRRVPEGLTVLYGEPGVGKTFVSLDWLLTVSALHDRPVVYFAGEGVSGLRGRIEAWRTVNPELNPAGFRIVPSVPRIMDPQQVELLANTVSEHEPAIIAIDTLARTLVGGDENSALDVGILIDVLDRVREKHGTSALVLHHSSKNGGKERGSGALRGAADAMWRLDQDEDELVLSCEKLKDGAFPQDSRHMLRTVGESAALWHPTWRTVA